MKMIFWKWNDVKYVNEIMKWKKWRKWNENNNNSNEIMKK